jgi:ketosteroid isomerase-like protein
MPDAEPPSADQGRAAILALYRRWGETRGGNLEEVLLSFADDIEIRTLMPEDGSLGVASVYRTREGARRYFADLFREFALERHQVDQLIVAPDGRDYVMVGRCTLRRRDDGGLFESVLIDVCGLRDGKVSRLTEMFDTLAFARARSGARG